MRSELEPGDVLLFPEPDLEKTLSFLQSGTASPKMVQSHNPLEPDAIEMEFAFHRLIRMIDDCPYTHATLVLESHPNLVLANSDENGLRRLSDGLTWSATSDGWEVTDRAGGPPDPQTLLDAPLSDIEWEYRDDKLEIMVLRLKDGSRDREPLVQAANDQIGQALPRPYPYIDMLPVGHLLTSRNRPITLPFLGGGASEHVERATRFVADRLQLNLHGPKYRNRQEQEVRMRGHSDAPMTFMCAAFVVDVFRQANLPISPSSRGTPAPPGPSALPKKQIDWLAEIFRAKDYTSDTRVQPHIRAELEAILEFSSEYLALGAPALNRHYQLAPWAQWVRACRSAMRGKAPRDSLDNEVARAASNPIEPIFSTAYDLWKWDHFQEVGTWFWNR